MNSNSLVINTIHNDIASITPIDHTEQRDIENTLMWIQSGEPIFRVAKPDVPHKHLGAYFVLFDESARKILLVDHKTAQLWLPSGGHVEPYEHPKDTVCRECYEELNIEASFWSETPIFIAPTITGGKATPHTDINIWYVLRGDHQAHYTFDAQEFHTVAWFSLDTIPFEKTDPHMKRFIQKLNQLI